MKKLAISGRRLPSLPILALVVVLPLAACGKGDPAGRADNARGVPNARGLAAGTATEAAPASVHVTDVSIGKSIGADGKVQSPTDRFGPIDTVFASVSTEGAGKPATLFAKWTFEDGQVIRNDQRTISPSGPAVTGFSVQKPGGWPRGGYKLDVSVDSGGAASTKTFKVE
ncbi:MAG: hypothetical protein ABJC61_09285 [Acidobacteriota bacterium]